MKARRPMDEKKETEFKHRRLRFVMIELSKGKSGQPQQLKSLTSLGVKRGARGQFAV